MSKTKLALIIFCAAIGVNILAFIFGNKAWLVEENKNVWLYELPASASPLDSGVATDFGPSQAIQGTLIRPGSGDHGATVAGLLASSWSWDNYNHSLTFQLDTELKYQDGTPITANHFVDSADYIRQKLSVYKNLFTFNAWKEWLDSKYLAISPKTLEVKFSKSVNKKDAELLITEVFTQALTGVIHPTNLLQLKQGNKITSEWISSGPYLIRKWRPKEVILVSRTDFAKGLDKRFFRTVKFQSAPVINPAAHFLQALETEKEVSDEHSFQARDSELHIFWTCRSWKDSSTVCSDANTREVLSKTIAGEKGASLNGQTVRYRIPAGSEEFRGKIAKQIQEKVTQAGGVAKEVSFLFKNSNDADIELQFITTKKGAGTPFAEMLARISSRLGEAGMEPNLLGEIDAFPLNVQFKGTPTEQPYEAYLRVFIEPDLGDKRLMPKK